MGFSSWLTCDTKESIMNRYTDECKTVYLLQPNGKEPIMDSSYDGYCRIGEIEDVDEWARDHDCEVKLSFNPDAVYEDWPASKDCPRQGFFAPREKEKIVEVLLG